MKKTFVLFVVLVLSNAIYSQGVYLLIGKNYTSYKLNYSGSDPVNGLIKKGEGDSYELGLSFALSKKRLPLDRNLFYTVGLNLNQYNAEAGNATNFYNWKTEYVGIKNSLVYSFIKSDKLDLAVKTGLNLETMLSGSQNINNSRYDLTQEKDFRGIILSQSLGISAKYNLTEYGYLSLGYNYNRSFNLSNNSDKKLSFLTNQILFGISFEIN